MAGKCIIIGAGDLTVTEIKRNAEDLVIAADGGYDYCKRLKLVPDLVVGDFDSLKDKSREELAALKKIYPERVIALPAEKDDTDMLAALKEGLEHGCREFMIYAGQGGRLDHTIANIQCLVYLKEHGAEGFLVDRRSRVMVIRNETITFTAVMNGYMSLFALGERAEGVTIRNMKYPLDRAVVTYGFPVGISNEFTGEEGSVTVENGMLLVILSV